MMMMYGYVMRTWQYGLIGCEFLSLYGKDVVSWILRSDLDHEKQWMVMIQSSCMNVDCLLSCT
jgi:hypothetical protein